MYSLIFEQIQTCCSRAAALVDRGDEGQDTIQWLPFEGSARKTWWWLTSTILIPESKHIWGGCLPNHDTESKEWLQIQAKGWGSSNLRQPWGYYLKLLSERETLVGNHLPLWVGLLDSHLGWPFWPQALCLLSFCFVFNCLFIIQCIGDKIKEEITLTWYQCIDYTEYLIIREKNYIVSLSHWLNKMVFWGTAIIK